MMLDSAAWVCTNFPKGIRHVRIWLSQTWFGLPAHLFWAVPPGDDLRLPPPVVFRVAAVLRCPVPALRGIRDDDGAKMVVRRLSEAQVRRILLRRLWREA